MKSTRSTSLTFAVCLLIGLVVRPVRADPSAALSGAMSGFAASLEGAQARAGLFEFDDEERFDIRFAPLGMEGVELNDLSADQRESLYGAMRQVLSDSGMAKVDAVRANEPRVKENEGGFFGFVMQWIRDPLRYFVAIFGDPAAGAAPWGFRFEGHHVSLSWTAVPGAPISPTPMFLGGQPREASPEGDGAPVRVLGQEEDRGFALARSLRPEQRSLAQLSFEEGSTISRPMFRGEGEILVESAGVGITRGELDAAQTVMLDEIVETYLSNFTDEVAAPLRERMAAEAATQRFSFATGDSEQGGPHVGRPGYYRVESESFLIEFDNTGPEADHIHVVLRERDGDFGRDLLREHREAHH